MQRDVVPVTLADDEAVDEAVAVGAATAGHEVVGVYVTEMRCYTKLIRSMCMGAVPIRIPNTSFV